jgi:hypothetical protein
MNYFISKSVFVGINVKNWAMEKNERQGERVWGISMKEGNSCQKWWKMEKG